MNKSVNNNELPLVTVAMPVYNAGNYLRLAVQSIIQQTFTNWELLIVDDGSTDNALMQIADINDPRIRILRDGKNKGLAARLNECVDLASGKYFARMDQDDVSYPERFLRQISTFEQNPALDLIAVRAITIDENDAPTGLFPCGLTHDEICARPWQGFYLVHPTWMGKIEWFRKHRYTVPGPYFCEDQELLLRSYRESQFCTVNEVLFAYRIRRKINWQKLAKTRRTVFGAQRRIFISQNQWKFVVLATAVFVARMGSDLLLRFFANNNLNTESKLDSALVSQWNSILEGLNLELRST